MDITAALPEHCMAHILSFTSPKDACRSSVVSPAFKSAADSDDVWKQFLPSDYREIISRAPSLLAELNSLPKKELYFRLCTNPIILDEGALSFGLDKETGKKCYMLASRSLSIARGDTPNYPWEWKFLSIPESRFSEVAQLEHVWWIELKGRIETTDLSPNTTYGAYLVYGLPQSMRKKMKLDDDDEDERSSQRNRPQPGPSQERGDGWMEIELGEFFNDSGDEGLLVCNLKEIEGWTQPEGLLVEGIELRPKD